MVGHPVSFRTDISTILMESGLHTCKIMDYPTTKPRRRGTDSDNVGVSVQSQSDIGGDALKRGHVVTSHCQQD